MGDGDLKLTGIKIMKALNEMNADFPGLGLGILSVLVRTIFCVCWTCNRVACTTYTHYESSAMITATKTMVLHRLFLYAT